MSEALLQTNAAQKATTLRQLLAGDKPLAFPGAFNAISAKLIEAQGFPGVYVTGAGLSNGVTGYPDIGFLSASEMAQFAGYAARAVNIPTIADADNGYGEAVNVFRTVQQYEREGLSGLHLEDQIAPKRCGHLNGKQVISIDHMCEKVAAAVSARSNPDFLIIARVDSRSVNGFDDAVARANRYMAAGADMIFPEALQDEAEFAEFARQVKAPLLANMTEFGKTPYLSVDEFGAMGYKIIIFPMTTFRVMMKSVEDALGVLKTEGTQKNILDRMKTRQELYELIHYPEYESLDRQLSIK